MLKVDHPNARRAHVMPFGACLRSDGTVRFRLWAPSHPKIQIQLDGKAALDMTPHCAGWHELATDRARAGTLYQFVLPDGLRVPDPASRHQSNDVHGPSEVIDPEEYEWCDGRWKGRPWHEAVVYELHIGAFTGAGTFLAAVEKLDHLASLGVTALEIMPVSDFPGRRNWGYDGVLPYAPASAYGRPEHLKAFVDTAHARGLMVLLDVVYNHFGPEGAYLHTIAPEAFTERHKTPWGAAINMDGEHARAVREFFIHNALYWIEEFNLDGLRLDAVHAIADNSDKHILEELAERVRAAAPDRHVHLILENEENEAKRLIRRRNDAPLWYTAQWNDDVHHGLHVAATGESTGYYTAYKGDTGKLGRALAEGFAFQGEFMPYRGRERGEPSRGLPPAAFVAFIQNHDQVGNRAFGDRLTAITLANALRAIAATYLLLPQIPMLFMGEEWGATQPFPFFCDFGPNLAEAVRNGRREEFARFPEFRNPAMREGIPDPLSKETFTAAKLVWEDLSRAPHARWLDWYRRILVVRHQEIVPRLPRIRSGGRYEVLGDGAVVVRWTIADSNEQLVLAANLHGSSHGVFPASPQCVLWREGDCGDDAFGPFAVRWSLEPVGPGHASSQPAEATQESTPALDRLSEWMGIEPHYQDARGRIIRSRAETKRHLLAAMGMDIADEASADRAAQELELREWLQPLPPVLVARTDAPICVSLSLSSDTEIVDWQLHLEGGTKRAGRATFAALDLIGSRMIESRRLERRQLKLPTDLPIGYHCLELAPEARMALIVTPGRCWLPEGAQEGRRLWGIAAQLYLLRSKANWGIGDFTDLSKLVQLAAAKGADVIGLNPLHALFADDPEHASPYSPASRLLLNVLNIDVAAIPETRDCRDCQDIFRSASFQQDLKTCRAQDLVDYSKVTELKFKALEYLFRACRDAADQTRWQSFLAFQRRGGSLLEKNCLFLVLRENFSAMGMPDWHGWSQEFQDPASPAVQRFRDQHRERLEFFAWMQWVADEQLGAAAITAAREGMAIGLYRDLAVGADRAGAETWINATAVVSGAEIGAPPDIYNPAGQTWGLPPFHPRRLRGENYRSFIELVRTNMRHAGGLRIDHVMGLQHLYWVPKGKAPCAGAYVRYPLDDLIGILALESERHHCLVVGEDLGTVPEGFRERMQDANVLSYRVLFFEQDRTGAFLPPDAYPSLALAVIGSHDLPTLRGWWEGRDLELKQRLGLFPDPAEFARQQEERQRHCEFLLAALRAADLLPPDTPVKPLSLLRAAHAFLARSPSMLAIAQMDDLTEETDPVNIPGTSDEHPNWRRRLSIPLEELSATPSFVDVVRTFQTERGEL
jgi:malto-oligosyltrehalose trehalohydrolase/4-alpha-glucanotransferase